ncbi:MAG: TolC family protein [Candidatus Marinimicrobia bacterium]|nr:TolC family protein [Candidatus Neomarinimicrobiota bacterium]
MDYKQNIKRANTEPITNNITVSLNEVLQYTLLYNPELKAANLNIDGMEALVLQSKSYENPELETELENVGVNAFSIRIGQLIELGGKRSARINLAKLGRSAAAWEYEIQRLTILVEAGKQFINTLKTQEMLDLLEQSYDIAERSYQTALSRKKAGVASEIEILQTEKEREIIKVELEKELNDQVLQIKLLSLYAGDQSNFTQVIGKLERPLSIPELSDLLSEINQSPDIVTWLIRTEELKILEKEAKVQVVPDLSVNAGYERNNVSGDNTFLLGFSIPLPVWNQNKGNKKFAEINSYKAAFEKKAMEIQIYRDLHSIYTDFENTFIEINVLNDKLIPIAKKTYQEAQKFYGSGKLSSMELLNYQRDLLENEMRYIDQVAEFYKLKYDLELLIGSEINIRTEG